jgi:hypothetical protein
MRSRQTTLSPLFRSLAALALVVFVAAQAMCFVHCHFGGGQRDKAQPSCHGSPQTTASHDGRGDHNGHDGPTPSTPAAPTTCSTLKTMLAGGNAPPLSAPQFHTLYLLAPISLALDATETQPEASFSRHARSRDWVFTPELCLGPAFRSLAPPFVG